MYSASQLYLYFLFSIIQSRYACKSIIDAPFREYLEKSDIQMYMNLISTSIY